MYVETFDSLVCQEVFYQTLYDYYLLL